MPTTKTKEQTLKLKEYVYKFKPLKDSDKLRLNKKSEIYLIVNGAETKVKLESMFDGDFVLDSRDVKGYSILQFMKDNKISTADGDFTITYVDKDSGVKFYVCDIDRPFMYDDDKEIGTDKQIEYLRLIGSSVGRTKSGEIVTLEEEAKIKAEEEAAIKAEEEKKKADKEAKEKADREAEEARIKAEEEAKEIAEEEARQNVLGGIGWEEARKELLDNGLKEYEFENYRFFYKGTENPEDTELYFTLLEPGEYYEIDLFIDETSDTVDSYTFEDLDNVEHRITFNKTEGVIKIEKI